MAGARIAVASDHAGFDLKELLKRDLLEAGHDVLDLGTNSAASVDYPDFGHAMAQGLKAGDGHTELFARVQVLDRQAQRSLHQAHGLGADAGRTGVGRGTRMPDRRAA